MTRVVNTAVVGSFQSGFESMVYKMELQVFSAHFRPVEQFTDIERLLIASALRDVLERIEKEAAQA